jgi:hypothetical protein
MPEEINFLQLACLLKVTQNTILERFGSSINASIFDASNIAGTLKQNGLIDFTAYYPGPNEIMVTDVGKALIAEAEAKSTEPFDKLDEAVLSQLSGGKRIPVELQNTLNLRPRDLALRLYKLNKQGYIIYNLKSGGVDLLLTESGFLKVNAMAPMQQPAPQAQMQQPAMQNQADRPASMPTMQAAGDPSKPMPEMRPGMKIGKGIIAGVVIIVIIAAAAIYYAHVYAHLI